MSDEQLSYQLLVDGERRDVVDAWWFDSLLTVLRDRLDVHGPKFGCGHGRCGACLVRVDDHLACACLLPAAAAIGSEISTVASLRAEPAVESDTESTTAELTDDAGGLTDVQAAFVAAGATQCGYCTPGFVMAVTELLDAGPDPSREQILQALAGNLCRCTGYGRIIEAVERAAAQRRGAAR